MTTFLLAVGKLQPAFREACDDYFARLRRYGPFEEREVREGPGRAAAVEQRRTEGKRLLDKVPERALVVALDRAGTAWSSDQLSRVLARWRDTGRPVTLVIGGSTGLDAAVLDRAEQRWSLGPLTLPHQLARVVVAEQWYRAHTILRGEKYHK